MNADEFPTLSALDKIKLIRDSKRRVYEQNDVHATWSDEVPVGIPAGLIEELLAEHNAKPELPAFMAGHQPVKINPRNGEDGERFEADDKLRQDEFFALVVDPAGMEYLQEDAVVWSDLETADAITSWLPGITWGDIVKEEADTAYEATFSFDLWSTALKDETVHRLVLDFDIPTAFIPSTTPGHGHFYIDRRLPWSKAVSVIEALAAVGILEPGYAMACIARGYATVRLPWVQKAVTAHDDGPPPSPWDEPEPVKPDDPGDPDF